VGKPPSMQEDYASPELDREKDLAEHGAPKSATMAVYVGIAVVLVILFLLIVVGLHIPDGG
jgi:hypothetical protein